MTDDGRRDPLAGVIGRKQTRTASLELDRLATRAEGDDRIPVALSSETPVDRWFGREILVHTRDAIDLSYAAEGLAFLDGHDSDRQIGLIEDVGLGDDGKLRGMLRQGNHPDAPWIFRDIAAGIRKNISVGYRINELKLDESSDDGPDVYRATRWTPMEGSTVSIPADITVGVGRSAEDDTVTRLETAVERAEKLREFVEHMADAKDKAKDPLATEARADTTPADEAKERSMAEQQPAGAAPEHKAGPVAVSLDDQRKAVADIFRLAAAHDMAAEAPAWVERGLTVEQVKSEIFDRKIAAARPVSVPGHLDLSPRDAARYNISRAVMQMVNKRWHDEGGLEKEVSDAVAKRLNKETSNILIPLDLPVQVRASATGNVAGTTSLGGAGVQTTVLPMIELLRNRMLVARLGARMLTGLTGNVTFPRHITANSLTWTGENPSSANSNTAATLDNVTLSPKTAMVSSAYSRQLLVQASFDASAFVQDDMATVAALGLDLAAIDGTGSSNQPTGIMRQSNVGTATFTGTNGGIPTWAELVAFETSVASNNADIGATAWVTTPGLRGKLKSTTAGSTYLWDADNTINGYSAHVTNQMPSNYTAGTNTTVAHGVLFGVFTECLIGEWGGAMELIVDPYTLAGQNMIQLHQVIMADIAVRHPKAFCVNKTALIA